MFFTESLQREFFPVRMSQPINALVYSNGFVFTSDYQEVWVFKASGKMHIRH